MQQQRYKYLPALDFVLGSSKYEASRGAILLALAIFVRSLLSPRVAELRSQIPSLAVKITSKILISGSAIRE
jgi:hypothetical protein